MWCKKLWMTYFKPFCPVWQCTKHISSAPYEASDKSYPRFRTACSKHKLHKLFSFKDVFSIAQLQWHKNVVKAFISRFDLFVFFFYQVWYSFQRSSFKFHVPWVQNRYDRPLGIGSVHCTESTFTGQHRKTQICIHVPRETECSGQRPVVS